MSERQRLSHVLAPHGGSTRQVGDRAGHTQHAGETAGGQAQTLGGMFSQLARVFREHDARPHAAQ